MHYLELQCPIGIRNLNIAAIVLDVILVQASDLSKAFSRVETMHFRQFVFLVLFSLVAAKDVMDVAEEGLASDDECIGEEECALNALQVRQSPLDVSSTCSGVQLFSSQLNKPGFDKKGFLECS